jgi:YbgC/YbaW family acyl-CoA thioester hydrolase
MQRSDFRHLDTLRVRWAEVDMQRIVFNGHYLMYFDTAVASYWRAMAMPYHETLQALGGDLFVRKATLEYLGSARYDDECAVGVRCARIGTSSMTFVCAVFRGQQLLVHGELVYVYADPASQSSRPVPQTLRDGLLGFEAGQTLFEVVLASWKQQQNVAMALRHSVFAHEQGIAVEHLSDSEDTAGPAGRPSLHALATNHFGLPVGCGRAVWLANDEVKIGRMAVHAQARGAGVGRGVLHALLTAAQAQGAGAAVLHAQASAVGFYRRLGFAEQGPRFEEVGIEHQTMRRLLLT